MWILWLLRGGVTRLVVTFRLCTYSESVVNIATYVDWLCTSIRLTRGLQI